MKPLDRGGETEFQPSGEIVHGTPRQPESNELAAVTRERDALANAVHILGGKVGRIGLGESRESITQHVSKTLLDLASGELRKTP
jgi:hypothetical protein